MINSYLWFTRKGVRFIGYPFRPASVYRVGMVPYQRIREIDATAAPPEVRTDTGEILFVPATKKEQLQTVAQGHGIPLRSRFDCWELILEPFLDTEFDAEHQERTLQTLDRHGIDRTTCDGLRRRVKDAMVEYNIVSGLWDWCHLGLYDLLQALSRRMGADEFASFYREAMAIANRADGN